jgi:hypothetical protein
MASRNRRIDRPRVVVVLEALARDRITRAEAEQLLGFLEAHEAGAPLPTRSTWYRRMALMTRAGLRPLAMPRVLRGT